MNRKRLANFLIGVLFLCVLWLWRSNFVLRQEIDSQF
jgi:hypothetical protein